MSISSSGSSQLEDPEENVKSEIWLKTFYIKMPRSISTMTINRPCITKIEKQSNVDMYIKFQFTRLSELHFKVVCSRSQENDSTYRDDYKLLFYCDVNFFDEDPIFFEMKSNECTVEKSFWLNASYKKKFSCSDLRKEIEVMILIKMIEYDCILTRKLRHFKKEFHQNNRQFYKNKNGLKDLCHILNIKRFDDIFTGRLNWQSIVLKSSYIKNTAKYSRQIADYLRSSNDPALPTSPNLECILNFLLHCKEVRINDEDLFKVYLDAHYFGMKFLIILSRDCILYRLSEYDITSYPFYYGYLFAVLKAALDVNDTHLFDKAWMRLIASKLDSPDKNIFDSAYWSKRLKLKNSEWADINARFVIQSLKRRLKKIEFP